MAHEFETIEQASEQFTSVAGELRKDKFLLYTAEQQELLCAAHKYLLDERKQAQDQAVKDQIVETLVTPLGLNDEEKAAARESYDVRDHMKDLFNTLYKQEETPKMESMLLDKALQKDIDYAYGMYNILVGPKIMSGAEAEAGQTKCREILEKMIGGDAANKSPNKELAELVEKCGGLDKVQFNIINENGIDGHASFSQKRADNGGSGIVINVSKDALSTEFEGLLMLLGHEFGHVLDASKRPEGYPACAKAAEEYWADLAGNQLVSNGNFTEREKFSAKMAFVEETKSHTGELYDERVEIMNGYVRQQHPKMYMQKSLNILRGTAAMSAGKRHNEEEISKDAVSKKSKIFGLVQKNKGLEI